MTEAEWLARVDYGPLITHLRGRKGLAQSARKWRLYGCACCRKLGGVWGFEPNLQRLGVVEEYADGLVEGGLARETVNAGEDGLGSHGPYRSGFDAIRLALEEDPSKQAKELARKVVGEQVFRVAYYGSGGRNGKEEQRQARQQTAAAMTNLVRDIFGNPFRPVAFAPEWRTSTVVAIAQGMYESRDFGAMPILADALQDAGCEDEAVLGHCRDENETHHRGCWVVDLVLGKA